MSISSSPPRIHSAARPGFADSPNEDLIIVLPDAIIVLDGATSVEHGPGSGGWYAGVLGYALARRLPSPGRSLSHVLADAIAGIVRTHQLQPGRSPSAALTLARWYDDRVDALVLCDTTLAALDADGQTALLHDDRLHRIDNPVRAAYLRAIADGAPFDSERLREMQAITRATATGTAATGSPRPSPTPPSTPSAATGRASRCARWPWPPTGPPASSRPTG
ncbi:hypothetical protein [Nonomuraea sp. NPDC049400]|uniref:hypothetical protein n=1 Tax=Nonomuraea sp. NPDC049400 TaxID=3364352 RepID=UPI0037969704